MRKLKSQKSIMNNLVLHPIHPFPARMAPSIALDSLKVSHNKVLKVLDPMVGSGTTAAVARALGHIAVGFDSDPLAVLIANAWCSDINESRVREKACEVLNRAKKLYTCLPTGKAYPRGANATTRSFVRYWFDATNRRQLTALAETISRIHDTSIKTILWCAFSRLIITKKIGASLAMDISHSRPHRAYNKAPIKPFDRFLTSVETIIRKSSFSKRDATLPKATIERGDARRIPLSDGSIDVVITSPPYLNAIDYLRGHKLSLVWMGYVVENIREIRSSNVGAERAQTFNENNNVINNVLKKIAKTENLPNRIKGMLTKYIFDMDLVLGEISRVLKSRGQAVIVIGDSTIHGTFVKNSEALVNLGRGHGLELLNFRKRKLQENRRYLPPPTSVAAGQYLQNRMREEVILDFRRSI
jgi:DNA modification methylase